MKKFIITVLILVSFVSANYAQKQYNMELKNVVQLNECTFRFDVYLTNTATDPVANPIAIVGITYQISYNAALKNGGNFNSTHCTYIAGTTQLESPNALATAAVFPNVPASANFTSVAAGLQWVMGTCNDGDVITYLDHNTPIRIGTFQVILRTTSSSSISKNFASVNPNFQLIYATNQVQDNDATLTDVSDAQDGGYMKYVRTGYAFSTLTNRTVTSPSTQKDFFGYCFTGSGNYSNNVLWNNAVGATGTGYRVAPSLATDNVQIGALTTVTNPAAVVGTCTFDAIKTIKDLTIKSSSTLTMNAGKQFTVNGTLYKENAGPAAITLKSDATATASLLNNTAGITATIERYIPAWTTNEGYHLLSSPVSGQAIAPNFVTTPATDYDFYLYNPAATPNVWQNFKAGNFAITNGGSDFVVGRGYLTSYAAAATHNFVGAMNVGNIAPTLAPAAGFNLVGNPYACAIQGNMSTFSPTGMNASVWVLDGASNSYRSWNGTTGTLGFTGEIPAMQGFFVQATSAGASFTIPASAKMHSASNFYKTTLDNHLELKVQSPNNTFDATVIYFKDENSNDVDSYDAMLMPSANPLNTQIYSYINSDKYCIDALATYSGPYTVNVGFEPKVDGNFTITADDVQSFNANSTITLIDLATGATQNLRTNPTYTFAATTAQAINRFKVVFDLVVGINDMNAVANIVYSFDNSIYIKTTEKVKSVSVFNMLGQEVENIQQPTSNVLTLNQATGYYTVRVITEANVYSQKVYIK